MGSESHLIATILEKYYKICEREEIFISQNSAEDKSAAAPYDKPGASSSIWLKNIKFDPFKGHFNWKREFLKHIKPLYKPSEEAFVLRHYLFDEVRNEVEGLGENIKQIIIVATWQEEWRRGQAGGCYNVRNKKAEKECRRRP